MVDAALKVGRTAEAVAAARALAEAAPHDADAWYVLGVALQTAAAAARVRGSEELETSPSQQREELEAAAESYTTCLTLDSMHAAATANQLVVLGAPSPRGLFRLLSRQSHLIRPHDALTTARGCDFLDVSHTRRSLR